MTGKKFAHAVRTPCIPSERAHYSTMSAKATTPSRLPKRSLTDATGDEAQDADRLQSPMALRAASLRGDAYTKPHPHSHPHPDPNHNPSRPSPGALDVDRLQSPILLPTVKASPLAINPMSVIGERVVIAMVGLP